MQSSISTPRLILNVITEEDHEFMMELVNTKGWIKFIGDRNVHSTGEAIHYIERVLATENLTYWVVRLKDTLTPIGVISFIKRKYLDHFDIGFAFLPEFTRMGYAYEAAKEVLELANKTPGFTTILATTIPNNVDSIRLLNKLGLHFDRTIVVDNETLNVFSTAVKPDKLQA